MNITPSTYAALEVGAPFTKLNNSLFSATMESYVKLRHNKAYNTRTGITDHINDGEMVYATPPEKQSWE